MAETEARAIVQSVTPAAMARRHVVGRVGVLVEGEVGTVLDGPLAAPRGRVAGQGPDTVSGPVTVLEAATGGN